ncbi:MAG: hypothetical protein PHP01_08495 [Phycisphaerae bacterium]|nr:hypothetical protein [Phycisphaerae bacterium]
MRLFLFMICSTAGILAFSLALFGPEWKELYHIEAAVEQAERDNLKIEQIVKDHEILTGQIEADPNILAKIAPITLGTGQDSNAPAVKMTADTLVLAKAVLARQENNSPAAQVPAWLERSTTKDNRIILFASGAGLVIVAFACFGRGKQKRSRKKNG